MQGVIDETFCGPVCQHPSCWQSQRRCNRGLPHTHYHDQDSESEEEGLPSQKVVNLLEDYGEDARDRFPTKWGGRAIHERASSMANLTRAQTRDSFPKVRAPNATPASGTRLLPGQRSRKPPIKKVEVQELFDLADLESDWHDTFQAKKVYVWVPNTNRRQKPHRDEANGSSVSKDYSVPAVLNPKDVTEDMVPEELEIERINQMMQRAERRECKTPTGGQPYSYPLTQSREYNGLYDLLDLPREVLADIVSHIGEREMKSKQQFVEAVIRTLPKLEKNHTAISLASSNVLLQQPVQLLQGELRRLKTLEPFTNKQIYRLDDDNVLEHLSTANEPHPARVPVDPQLEKPTRPEPLPSPSSLQEQVPAKENLLNKMKPLPSIGSQEDVPREPEETERVGEDSQEIEEDEQRGVEEQKKKMSSVALGLPTIPSGLRYTKTFDYNQQDFDFTLCPIPSPLQGLDAPYEESCAVTSAPSTVRGTYPTACTPCEEENTPASETIATRENTNVPMVTQMVVHMPKTPNATPVTRGSTVLADHETTLDPSKFRDASPSPFTTTGASPRQPTIVIQKSLALAPDVSGSLKPIAEVEGDQEEMGTIRHQMPRRVPRNPPRSVHFGPTILDVLSHIPPQPPCSPSEGENTYNLNPWQLAQLQANNANYQAYARHDDELMVVGKGTKGPHGAVLHLGQAMISGPPHNDMSNPVMTSDSAETRQQLEEIMNRGTGSSQKSPASALSDQRYDSPLRKTPGSYLSKSAASNSSRDSALTAKRQLEVLESPAPPPPSPEPRDLDPMAFNGARPSSMGNNLGMLAEEETESDLTISAKPPSNLESVSRIPSPRSLATDARLADVTVTREASEVSQLTGPQCTSEWVLREQVERNEEEQTNSAEQRNLEQFDADDETFKAELQREYEKLAKQLT